MKRVRLLTDLSFPFGGAPNGTELDLPDAQAESLLGLGMVTLVPEKAAAPEVPKPKAPEKAAAPEATTIEPHDEHATLPRSAKRPRGNE